MPFVQINIRRRIHGLCGQNIKYVVNIVTTRLQSVAKSSLTVTHKPHTKFQFIYLAVITGYTATKLAEWVYKAIAIRVR